MRRKRWNRFALWAGPGVFVLLSFMKPALLPPEAWMVIRLAIWMLIWWVSEALPMAVTSLLPLVMFPLLGIMPISESARSYGSPFVFLFFGGFVLSLAMEKWNLHKRIALGILARTGSSSRSIILGFMLATAFLSMWISNTATTVMMLPIGVSMVALFSEHNKGLDRFALSLFLGIAYAANVGGIATLIGTPPNGIMVNEMQEYGIAMGFMEWMKFGLPFSILLLGVIYWLLTRVIFPLGKAEMVDAETLIDEQLKSLGKMSSEEIRVLGVFVSAALLWMTKTLINPYLWNFSLNDTSISVGAAILLFIIPGHQKQPLLEWKDTQRLPWGILLLFGGGLALAEGFKSAGIIDLVAATFQQSEGSSLFMLTLVLTFSALFLTELMSNLALVSVFVPIVAAISVGAGHSPLVLALPVTLAASCAFMLPMATPPNAIVFGSGYVRISQMARAGLILNLVACVLITVFCYLIFEFWL